MLEKTIQLESSVSTETLPGRLVDKASAAATETERKVKNTILVPLDGSHFAERVIPHARALAKALGYGLKLLRVVPPPVYVSPIGAGLAASPALWDTWEEEPLRAREYLAGIAQRLNESGLEVTHETVEGNPVYRILEHAIDKQGVALIAMSTHGRSGLTRLVFGSVAEQVLHASPVPLLLLRGSDTNEEIDLTTTHYTRIVVPLDGSLFAEQALEWAAPLAQATGAALVLLTVAETAFDATLSEAQPSDAQEWEVATWEGDARRLREYLSDIASRFKGEELEVNTLVAYGDPATEIVAAGSTHDNSLVAMSTRGRTGLAGVFLGSVAREVSRQSVAPLLLVRVEDPTSEEPS